MVIVAIIIIAAVIARRSQKHLKAKEDEKAKTTQTEKSKVEPKKTEVASTKVSIKKTQLCLRCGSENDVKSKFCVYCGGTLVGRAVKTPETITPANSKKCSACGSKLIPTENYCKYCGTRIEQ